MKQIEGLLRYDVMDLEQWCFDMGHEIIPIYSGTPVRIQIHDRFQSGALLETEGGGLSVLFGGKHKQSWTFALERSGRYLAKMTAETVEAIYEKAGVRDLEQHSDYSRTEPPLQNDDFYF